MPALNTVSDYIVQARIILQDKAPVSRYADEEIIGSLGMALLDARRMRPDLFLASAGVPQDITPDTTRATVVNFEPMYRPALIEYIVGHALMRETEEAEVKRGESMKNRFVAKLLSSAA